MQTEEHNKEMKEIKHTLENEIKLLKKDLNQSKQKIEILKKNTTQLQSLGRQEVDKKVETQSRCIKRTEQSSIHLANIPLIFMYSDKLPTASALFLFVSNNETQQIFDNLVEFLKPDSVCDFNVMKDAWSYRKDDNIHFIWLIANFKA